MSFNLKDLLNDLTGHHAQPAKTQAPQKTFIPYADPQRAAATVPGNIQQQPSLGQQLQAHIAQVAAPVGLPQGNAFNPGASPLQASDARNPQLGAPIFWQNTDGQRRNMVNPQVEDNGFYYN